MRTKPPSLTSTGKPNVAVPYAAALYAGSERAASTTSLFVLVFGAMSFNMGLCFLNTNIGGIGDPFIIACEITIISTVLLFCLRQIDETVVLLIGSLVLYALTIVFIRYVLLGQTKIDVKPARDLLIPMVFFVLGTRARDIGTLDTIVRIATIIVVAVAVFEYFLPDLYTRGFNVAAYYISRGLMQTKQAAGTGDLFISGMRPAGGGGRNLLPFLGDHRVSSIFLEPISLANFGNIVFLWGLFRSRVEGKLKLGLLVAALSLVVLSDSRFGAYFCFAAIIFLFVPPRLGRIVIGVAPVVALIVLPQLPDLLRTANVYGDNFLGRLLLSGIIMSTFDNLGWFGLSDAPMPTFDSGYGYSVNAIGPIAAGFAWCLFLSLERPGGQFNLFRNLAAAYYAAILCVSYSPYTIKTAALLWFLLGGLYQMESGPSRLDWRAVPRTRPGLF